MNSRHVTEQGAGKASVTEAGLELCLPSASASEYSNAMVTSYQARAAFEYGSGTRLELTASSSGNLQGTAGFGFWNHPAGTGIRPPRAVWFFFASPPSNMPLAAGVPGFGFKAAVFDAQRVAFYGLLPFAPIGVLLMRVPFLYRTLWPIGQWAIGVDEHILDARLLLTPRQYSIDWRDSEISFGIDGNVVFRTKRVPSGLMGFVAWVDNQYAVVTPQGQLRFGLIAVQECQGLTLTNLQLTSLTRP